MHVLKLQIKNPKLSRSQMWNQAGFQWKTLPLGHLKIFFQNPFSECPGFHKSDCFCIKKQLYWPRMHGPHGQKKACFPLSSFAFPVFSHCLSHSFSVCNAQCILFLLPCLLLCSLPFWQPAQVESLEGEDCSSSLWFLRLSDSAVGFQLPAVPLAWSSTCYAL